MGRKFESCRAGQLEILHILLQNITALDIKYFYEGFDYRPVDIVHSSDTDSDRTGLLPLNTHMAVRVLTA